MIRREQLPRLHARSKCLRCPRPEPKGVRTVDKVPIGGLWYLEAGTLFRGTPDTVAFPVGLDAEVLPPGTKISSAYRPLAACSVLDLLFKMESLSSFGAVVIPKRGISCFRDNDRKGVEKWLEQLLQLQK